MMFDAEPPKQIAERTMSIEQIMDVMRSCPVYANKFYFSVEDGLVRIVFADENAPNGIIVVRSSIIMSVNGLIALSNMITAQVQRIQQEIAKAQQAVIEKGQAQ